MNNYQDCQKSACKFCAACQIDQNFVGSKRGSPQANYNNNDSNNLAQELRCGILQKFHTLLTRSFYKLGKCIALCPSYFIILPIFFTLLGLTGLQRSNYEEDPEILFYPKGGLAPNERDIIEKNFPLNYSRFLPYHLTRISGFTRILIKAKDDGTILRTSLWEEIVVVDEIVKNVEIKSRDQSYKYVDLCSKWNDECQNNNVLDLYDSMSEIENKSMVINYPIMLFPLIVPMYFGGIQLDEEEVYIQSAKAINLNYFLREDTDEDKKRSLAWETEFLSAMGKTSFEKIHVSYFAASSMTDLVRKNPEAIVPYVPLTLAIVIFFCMSSAMMSDWVRSKIYLGFIGFLSAAMATGAAFGFLMYFGVPTTGINNIIPFLMIGIGVDDMFVVLGAWRRTPLQDSTKKRLAKTYAEAGVSITITSLTNMISFSIGALTPILAVRIFCVYTAFSIVITFIWHLSFFGGCLALAGNLEKKNKHAILCVRVKPKSEAENKCYSFWCAGGIGGRNPWNPVDNEEHVVMVFFRDYLGKMLTKNYAKGIVIFLFLIYLTGAIYGCTNVKEGLDRRKLVRDDSYIVNYYDMEDKLFRKYPYPIQVVLTGNITYSDQKTKLMILDLHSKFEEIPYVANKILSNSWIRSFYSYLKRMPKINRNITNETSFIQELRENYLDRDDNPMALDVKFNEDFSRITACRFILQTYQVNDTNADKDMMLQLRKVAEEAPFDVTVFTPNFILFDQYATVRSAVMQSTFAAAIAMIIICLIFIPNPWCSLHVGFAILSIEIGVIGYMSIWNVSLDPISMVTLIMCIGFSVDFSSHVSYSYLTAKSNSPNEKIRECLFCLGLPILQGGISTLVSMVTFVLVPSYAYLVFFKVTFLVVIFAGLHGLFLIPVLLSIAGPDSLKLLREKKISANTVSSTLSDTNLPDESSPDLSVFTPKIDKNNLDICSSFEDLPSKFGRIDPEGCSNSGFKMDNETTDESPKEERSEQNSEEIPEKEES